jgi:hypothetical protein
MLGALTKVTTMKLYFCTIQIREQTQNCLVLASLLLTPFLQIHKKAFQNHKN